MHYKLILFFLYLSAVKITQTYKNVETDVIKATYKFPINESAAVCAFEAEIDGKKVQGVVKEAQEAIIEYNDMNEVIDKLIFSF